MSGAPFHVVLAVHAVTLGAVAALTLCSARRSPLALALAALLFNALPISPLLGMDAPIYLQDLGVPLVLGLALWRGSVRDLPLLALVAAAAFLWPALGTLVGLQENVRPALGENAEFLFRRLAFVAYFAAGLWGVLKPGQLARFLDAGLALWVGMAVAGLLQYQGVLETDLWSAIGAERRGQLTDPDAVARGFMGLNRGAVGVWGSAAVAYAIAMLGVVPRRPAVRLLGYGVAATLSAVAILLAGSRTGVVAALAAVVYTAVRLTVRGRSGAWRVLAPAAAAAVAVSLALPGLVREAAATRFAPDADRYATGLQRAEVQRATIAYVLDDARALTIGMGQSVVEFHERVGRRYGLSHSHSEYVDVLWGAGLVGLGLYAAFVCVLFARLRPLPGAPRVLFAARSMLVAGAVAGTAVGNFFVTSARLAPFGLLMAFVYGAFVHEASAALRLPEAARAPRPPPQPAPGWEVPC